MFKLDQLQTPPYNFNHVATFNDEFLSIYYLTTLAFANIQRSSIVIEPST